MSSILEIASIGKRYKIRHQAGGYLSLREKLSSWYMGSEVKEDFWALKDISFTVNHGESLGIIGRNGAGKSTLLKILSRITPPTTGSIKSRGRLASLLEVGTGFHPELTGRENIFFNGSLLGMKKKEIERSFDAIVDFSGVEKFLDTPLKHFSSGMQLRLAFSVAAFLEPEILVIDEVLAVGDSEFQKKCIGKMDEVSKKEGRTILFVSHNLGAVQNLCVNSIVLKEGQLMLHAPTPVAIKYYTQSVATNALDTIELSRARSGTQEVIFKDLYITNEAGEKIDNVLAGTNVNIVAKLKVNVPVEKVNVGFSFHDIFDSMQSVVYSGYQDAYFNFSPGYHDVTFSIKDVYLAAGNWTIKGLIRVKNEVSDWPKFPLASFNIDVANYYGTGHLGDTVNETTFLVKGSWRSYEG